MGKQGFKRSCWILCIAAVQFRAIFQGLSGGKFCKPFNFSVTIGQSGRFAYMGCARLQAAAFQPSDSPTRRYGDTASSVVAATPRYGLSLIPICLADRTVVWISHEQDSSRSLGRKRP